MQGFVRNLLLSRPVVIGGAVIVGAREFLALQRTQVRPGTRRAPRQDARESRLH